MVLIFQILHNKLQLESIMLINHHFISYLKGRIVTNCCEVSPTSTNVTYTQTSDLTV